MSKKNLDILLINTGNSKKKIYQSLSKSYSAIEPPFWAALTAGFLRSKGFSVDILDANAENLTHKETTEIITNVDPKLVNIVVYGQHPSASTQLMTEVGNLCKKIKNENPVQKVILTGLHPSALPRKTLEEEACDYVAEGEGFFTIQGLLEGMEKDKILGLWWKEKENIRHNLRAKNIKDLSKDLGDIAWDLLPLNKGKYRAHNHQCLDDFDNRTDYASISTSLGCPFKCDFCSIHKTFGERKIRYWSPEWVVNQINILHDKHDVRIFKIIDEMFILNPNHYLQIADKLIERGLNKDINIWAYARVDTTKEKHLKKLREAGFKWFCFGFESGNEDILKEVHKGNYTKKDMLKISEKTRNSGIGILANYMFGFPNDNLKTMQETLDLALEQNCEFVNLYCATAWPGSALYDQVKAQGIELPNSWHDYAQHSYGFKPLPTKNLSAAGVLSFRDKAFHTYFTNHKYLNMIEKKFGTKAKEHVESMTKIKLKRKILGD